MLENVRKHEKKVQVKQPFLKITTKKQITANCAEKLTTRNTHRTHTDQSGIGKRAQHW